MSKLYLAFLMVYLVSPLIAQNDIEFVVNPVQCRDEFGRKHLEWARPDEISLLFNFSSEKEAYLSFNYEQIYTKTAIECTKIDSNSLMGYLRKIKYNQLIIENSEGYIVSFSRNYPFPVIADSSFDYRPLIDATFGEELVSIYPSRNLLFSHGAVNKKYRLYACTLDKNIRLHFIYYPNKAARKLGSKHQIITSRWFNLDDVIRDDEDMPNPKKKK